MQPLGPRASISTVKNKAGTALRNRKALRDLAAAQAAARAQAVAQRFARSPLADSPIGQAVQQYLEARLAAGENPVELARELREKARSELVKRRHVVMCLARIAALFRGSDKEYRFRTEVVHPARALKISGEKAWRQTDLIANSLRPLLQVVWDEVGPPYTLGVCATAKISSGAGFQWAAGICGLRHTWGCFVTQYSVSLGLSAGGDTGLQVSLSRGLPANGISWGLEVGAAGGVLAQAGVSVAFVPAWRDRPQDTAEWLFQPALWEFTGVSISLGSAAAEVDLSVSLGRTTSFVLGPAEETEYSQAQREAFEARLAGVRTWARGA